MGITTDWVKDQHGLDRITVLLFYRPLFSSPTSSDNPDRC